MRPSRAGFRTAYWDFEPKADSYLHVNRELRLLLSAPREVAVTASLNIRARVRLRKGLAAIPLRAKALDHDYAVTLVPAPAGTDPAGSGT